jgi:hypothetical protein
MKASVPANFSKTMYYVFRRKRLAQTLRYFEPRTLHGNYLEINLKFTFQQII